MKKRNRVQGRLQGDQDAAKRIQESDENEFRTTMVDT